MNQLDTKIKQLKKDLKTKKLIITLVIVAISIIYIYYSIKSGGVLGIISTYYYAILVVALGFYKDIFNVDNYIANKYPNIISKLKENNNKSSRSKVITTPHVKKVQPKITNSIPNELNRFINKINQSIKDETSYELIKSIGLQGEKIVLDIEENRLKNFKSLDREYPIHVSKNNGDEFGFDILSIDGKNQPLLIEVKTTTKSKDSTFKLTRNEYETMKQFPNNYIIYKIYNFNQESKDVEIIKLNYYKIEESYTLTPNKFIANKN